MREIVHGALAIGTIIGILVTLGLVLVYGSVAIIEPRVWVVYLELVAGILVLALDLERLVDDARKLGGPK